MSSQRALLIGINGYYAAVQACPHRECPSQLYGCLNDVANIYELLVKFFEFPPDNIKRITDETEIKPTKDAIVNALECLVEETRHEDVVVIYYAGHGSRIVDETKPSNWMETIVPIDSGRCNRHPSRDIPDDKIRLILEQLLVKTDYITLIFDSCFSGHITRDITGLVFRNVVPVLVPEGQIVEQPGGSRGLLTRMIKPVLLAACQPDELAGDGKSGGFWTAALVRAINILITQKEGKHISYKDVFEKAFQDVVSKRKTQHPLIEGQQDRDLFGTEHISSKPYASVTKIFEQQGQKMVAMDVGSVQGIAPGSIFTLYPEGIQKNVDGQHVLVKVNKVSTATCSAAILGTAPFEVKLGCCAYEKFTPSKSIKVKLVASSEIEAWIQSQNSNILSSADLNSLVENLKKKLENLEKKSENLENNVSQCSHVRLKQKAKKVDFALHLLPPLNELRMHNIYSHLLQYDFDRTAPCIAFIGEDNSIIAKLIEIAKDQSALDGVIETVENLGKYYRGLRLQQNDNLNNPIHGLITMEVESSEDRTNWTKVNKFGLNTLYEGCFVQVHVHNQSPMDVYISLIDFAEDGSTEQIYPPKGGRQLLKKGKPFTRSFEEPLEVKSELVPTETIKLFASTVYANLELFMQPAFRSLGRNQSTQEDADEDFWTTDQCMFRIKKRIHPTR